MGECFPSPSLPFLISCGVQIDDLEGPYTNYSTKFCSGFDTWEPVQANPRVRTILAMFSSSCPPPLPTSSPAHPAEPPIWTLDELFLLPKGRIKYYKKLYNRLLKSTTPGRSDHRMLTGALEKLDKLLATIDSRASVRVDSGNTNTPNEEAPPPIETEDEVVIDMRARQSTLEPQPRAPESGPTSPSQRASDSTRASGSLSSRYAELRCDGFVRLHGCADAPHGTAVGGLRIRRPRRTAGRQPRRCQCPLLTSSGGSPPNGRWISSR